MTKINKLLLSLLFFFYGSVVLIAQDFEESDSMLQGEVETVENENFSVPKGMEGKKRMSEKDLAAKKEGSYITGLPLVNYDPDNGFGYGARAYYFVNGSRNDPYFAYTPYRHQFFAQYFATTNGAQYHWIDWDAPYFGNTLYRVRASFIYDRNKSANYFGLGSETLSKLVSPTDGKAYDSLADYTESLRQVDASGNTYSYFNEYDYEKPIGRISVERDMFGGILRPQVGITLLNMTIYDYTGKTVPSDTNPVTDKDEAKMNQTLLNLQRPLGYDGGFENLLRVGLAYDTRDYEPDPNNGIFTDAVIEVSDKSLGSDYTFQRYTVTPRVYFSPFPDLVDLVLAGRFTYSTIDGDAPFYEYTEFGLSTGNQNGLGGLRTIRGYAQDRFVGRTKTFMNYEIRWTMFTLKGGGQTFGFMLVPFVDFGRVFDSPADFTNEGWKQGTGTGLRVAWNKATIIMVDYAQTDESSSLYINFSHIF